MHIFTVLGSPAADSITVELLRKREKQIIKIGQEKSQDFFICGSFSSICLIWVNDSKEKSC